MGIAALILGELKSSIESRGIAFTWTDEALRVLAQDAVGGRRGARDLHNTIRRQVEDVIAMRLVSRADCPPAAISVGTDESAHLSVVLTEAIA